MSKFGVMVMGPAGAGKSTFCTALISHLRSLRRSAIYINLDPAATSFTYEPDIDIKDLISVDDVMEELGLGPNGALMYCFEFLLQNLDFLTDALETVTDEYLVIIDMPGQIELYTHVPIVPRLVQHLTRDGSLNMRLCATYLLEATFIADRAKFFAGTLSAMSAMLMLEMPHLNVLSKMDLVKKTTSKRELKRFVNPDAGLLDEDVEGGGDMLALDVQGDLAKEPMESQNLMGGSSFKRLNQAVARLIDEYGMVSFLQLDVQDEDSVGAILSYIDDTIQFHEAQEPREPMEEMEADME